MIELKEHEIEYWLEPKSASNWTRHNLDPILKLMDSLTYEELRECFYLYNCDVEKYVRDKNENV